MNQAALMRISAALIVVMTVLATLIIVVVDYLTGRDLPVLVYVTFSTAFTTALGYLFLDKGVSLTNSPATDLGKQALALIVQQYQATQPAPPPTPAQGSPT